MSIYVSYILRKYFKSFIVIFLALEFFAVGIDLLENLKKIPSANMQLLYAIFIMIAFLKYTIPLSLIFAMVSSKFQFVKSNELVSMYALGLSRKAVIQPVFLASLLVTALYVFLNLTSAAYAQEYARNIKHNQTLSKSSENLFLRYYNNFIFFKKLDPFRKVATGVKVFVIKDNDLLQVIEAKSAIFEKDIWVLHDASITTKPKHIILGEEGLSKKHVSTYKTLAGFKPSIIENVHEGKTSFTIAEAIQAITLFKEQHITTYKIESTLYMMVFFPFFAPFLVIIFFYFIPPHARFVNTGVQNSIFVFLSIMTWGVLFMLGKLSFNGVIDPFLASVAPIIALGFVALYFYHKAD